MTLLLKTESHGEIESGFYSTFIQFARLGEHTFATRHLCELVEYLAENPQVSQTQIIGYDLDKFSQRFNIERQLELQQGEISVEDEVDLYDEGKMIPVRVSNDEKAISIGEYRISAIHFGKMAAYLVNGGFIGWGIIRNKNLQKILLEQ